MKPLVKFGLLTVSIIGTLGWLAADGVNQSKTYYSTISEVGQMGKDAQERRLRVGGDVAEGSIQRLGREVHFTLMQDSLRMKVVYAGIDPLPDTFRDGAQALVDGRMDSAGTFHAQKIQAKCASKYEAKPGQVKPGYEPVNQKRAS
ncbi:MAG: cytochrome c maturation protein CcmE [Acidobacteria bacterium]|nr:cytochrome c maturation protein CcmE [Acidobacteriota bacterium]